MHWKVWYACTNHPGNSLLVMEYLQISWDGLILMGRCSQGVASCIDSWFIDMIIKGYKG